jgi:tRNA pseudouridine-54 N-methylase
MSEAKKTSEQSFSLKNIVLSTFFDKMAEFGIKLRIEQPDGAKQIKISGEMDKRHSGEITSIIGNIRRSFNEENENVATTVSSPSSSSSSQKFEIANVPSEDVQKILAQKKRFGVQIQVDVSSAQKQPDKLITVETKEKSFSYKNTVLSALFNKMDELGIKPKIDQPDSEKQVKISGEIDKRHMKSVTGIFENLKRAFNQENVGVTVSPPSSSSSSQKFEITNVPTEYVKKVSGIPGLKKSLEEKIKADMKMLVN